MVTIKNIAEAAGVSPATVSLVLNGRDEELKISPLTRDKVLATAAAMNYQRNEIARSMVTGRTRVIGFLISRTYQTAFTAKILRAAMTSAANEGFLVQLLPFEITGSFSEALSHCLSLRPAGLICTSLPDEVLEHFHQEALPANIPITIVDSSFPHDWGIRVVSDDIQGAELIVDHLVRLGHTRIAHFAGTPGAAFAEAREAGFVRAMRAHGLSIPESAIQYLDPPLYDLSADEADQKVIEAFQRCKPTPTAVFCSNDADAAVTLRAAHKMGLHVPGHLSVAGFANLSMAAYTDPPLTTVEQPFEAIGRRAVAKLISEIKSKQKRSLTEQIEELLPVTLITRASTAPAV